MIVIPRERSEPSNRGLLSALKRLARWRRFLSFSLLWSLCSSAFSSPLFAQSCAMCYDQASQAGAKASRAIDLGILLLLIPTLLLFMGVLAFAVHRAHSTE